MRGKSAYQIIIATFFLHVPLLARATEALVISPFVGETAQEFEARKRGIAIERPNPRSLIVPADERGHFFVEPEIDGRRLRMLVDTGASLVALSHEDARQLSISPSARDFTHKIATANGIVDAAPVRLKGVQLGDILVRDVDAVVLPAGRLKTSLLGMTFLRRLRAFEITNGQLQLHR